MKKFNFFIGRVCLSLSVVIACVFVLSFNANAAVIFDNEFLLDNTSGDIWIIDSLDDATGDVFIQFGNDGVPANNGLTTWDISETDFLIDDQTDLGQNQILLPVWENLAAPPGSPSPGQIYTDTGDGNTYVYSGAIWEDITLISATASKVISVGTGLDYASLETGAGYLNTLSGGIMLLSAETHSVTNAVDLTNIILIGKDPTQTTIALSGAGQFDTFDTTFVSLTLDVNSIIDDMALDVQTGTSSLLFEFVDIDVQDSGDSLIDSNAGGAPLLTLKMVQSEQMGSTGTILKAQGSGNISASSTIIISGSSGTSLIMLEDWDVTIAGAASVLTSGVISTVPSNTIFVYPGMNLQAAVNSLPSGGSITVLPGVHSITSPLLVSSDSIDISGYGDDSVISATGFTGTGVTTAAIQIGAADGTSPVDNVTIRDLKLEVSGATGVDDIHGLRAAGGSDHRIMNVTIQKMSGQSGTGATARMGIHFIDGTADFLERSIISNNVVIGNGGTNYFTDGIHVTSDSSANGVFGNNTGIENVFIDGNLVDYVRETAYVFAGVNNSDIVNNISTRMGVGGAGYGNFVSNVSNVKMDGNVFTGSLGTGSIALGIEPFNLGSLKSTVDSVFTNNVIEGESNSGVGFGTGFQIGSTTANTLVARNVFQNNTIRGPSNAGGSTAFLLRTNADDNLIADNVITGATNSWVTGINITSAVAERNLIQSNRFQSVTTLISNTGVDTRLENTVHLSTIDPVVGDDITDGFLIGTFWVNTSSGSSFISVDDAAGAAVWNTLVGSGGGETLDDFYDNDAGERTVTVDAGDVSWDLSVANTFILDLQGTGDILFQDGGITFATFTDAGDLDLVNNLTIGASTETISNGSFSLNGDDVFIADSLGVEGQIYTDTSAEKYIWLDIFGGVRTALSAGSVGGGQSPVLRLDSTDDSEDRWSFPVPDDWESGSDILLDFFWTPADAAAGNVHFQFDYAAFAVGETIAGGSFTALTSTEATPVSQLELSTVTFTMLAANLAADDMINFRLRRDPAHGSDTYADDANIHKIRIRYTGKKIQ
jgi:hypothetical protein